MRFVEFQKALKSFTVFSYADILKIDPSFDRRRLVEWQNKNYIKKLRNRFYTFIDTEINEDTLYYISNLIYKPSYVSLESALSYYNLIPEAVYLTTGISTRKTNSFDTPVGNFSYRSIREDLFFGYNLVRMGNHTVRIANPEKTLLDYLYLNSLNEIHEIEAMRINKFVANELINPDRLHQYMSLYRSGIMEKRIQHLMEYIYAES
jgi:predicted transcriptional regulator of viral defense system